MNPLVRGGSTCVIFFDGREPQTEDRPHHHGNKSNNYKYISLHWHDNVMVAFLAEQSMISVYLHRQVFSYITARGRSGPAHRPTSPYSSRPGRVPPRYVPHLDQDSGGTECSTPAATSPTWSHFRPPTSQRCHRGNGARRPGRDAAAGPGLGAARRAGGLDPGLLALQLVLRTAGMTLVAVNGWIGLTAIGVACFGGGSGLNTLARPRALQSISTV